ncbi:MAG: hypothetical protein HDS14_04000 [Bacteroides sp.]|nr:hypothetical protein [Bacteroides sp.]
MSILSQHIEYLLINRECVILPGIGAFIATVRSARIDETTDRIIPPFREVSFNPAVTTDDGLLAHSLGRSYHLPFEEARERLEELISALRKRLSEDGMVELGKVGVLTVGEENSLLFTPSQDEQSQWRSLGITPLAIPRRGAGDKDGKETQPILSPAGLIMTQDGETKPSRGEVCPSNDRGGDYCEGYYHFRVSKRALRIAASLLIVLGVCVSIIIHPFGTVPEKGEKMASILPVWQDQKNETISVEKSPAIENPIADSVAKMSSPDTIDKNRTEVEDYKATTRPQSHLIVGAFNKEESARIFIHSKEKEGVEGLKIVTTPRGLYLVSAFAGTSAEAHKALNDPATRKLYPESWVLD